MKSSIVNRREFLKASGAVALTASALEFDPSVVEADERVANLRDRVEGMLLGTLIGDAAGGPVEGRNPKGIESWMPATRTWPDDRRLDASAIGELKASFRLLSYEQLRPQPRAYAHWTQNAPPGTVTDDSRFKFLLIAALRKARQTGSFPITERDLAEQFLAYCDSDTVRSRPHYRELCEEWLGEYNKAARWVLGERDLPDALPVERLWGGVATNAGQMVLLPLGAVHAGEPEAAYRAAYHLGFVDNGEAKDINSALVAGLAAALATPPGNDVKRRWEHVYSAIRSVDPYVYGRMRAVRRSTVRWLDFARKAVQRSDRKPKRLFEILEREAQPRYFWDAHFVFVSTFAILELCDFDPLASLHLALDFGHDTDSTAQLLGAFVGAIDGAGVFPAPMRRQVTTRLKEDYDQSVDEWTELLLALNDRTAFPTIVKVG